MKRFVATAAFLFGTASASLVSACAAQECAHLADCPGSQMCSADGRCINDDREVFSGRNGGGELGLRSNGDADGADGDVDLGPPLAAGEATMFGRIGPIGGFAGAAVADVFHDSAFGYTVINVTAESAEGRGLFILNLANGVNALPLGTTRWDAAGANDGLTYTQLCSDSASVHFDGIPAATTVTTTPNGAGFDLQVTTTIDEGFTGSSYANPEPTELTVRFHVDA